MALTHPIFKEISRLVEERGLRAYVIGGYVRDHYLHRPNTDIDIVVARPEPPLPPPPHEGEARTALQSEGDRAGNLDCAVEVAEELGRRLKTKVTVFKNFGTAMLRWRGVEIEIVGARRESYSENSRKPDCEPGTIEDDQLRRDFTINALGWSLNEADFGELSDPFGGLDDLDDAVIRTPRDPDITFSDDPLRMMRAVRFAAQLGFDIDDETFEAIRRNAERIKIVSAERVIVELNKIVASPVPSMGFHMLEGSGLLKLIFPEMVALKGVDKVGANAHKDNFIHTLKVLDNVAAKTNPALRPDDLWLRWAAIMHDIGKPATKAYSAGQGWTFHQHEVVGSKMVPRIFRRLRLPLDGPCKFVQKLVFLHLRPIVLSEDEVTDSAVRRLLFEAGDDVESLMTLCEADITSGNDTKVRRYLANFELVRRKMVEIEEKDRIRTFQPPITGDLIMQVYGIPPSNVIGEIKEVIKEAILEGIIPNEYEAAYAMMERLAEERGLIPVRPRGGAGADCGLRGNQDKNSDYV